MFDLVCQTRTPLLQPAFLPMSRSEMDALGWDCLDVLLITGDAHVDHPSFGVPLLGRWLVAHGFRTGLVAQPRWDNPELGNPDHVACMGRPRLMAGVSAGALDSMLAHFTAFRKKRHDDAYTPGGKAGARPNRAVIVYANLARQAFPGLPILAGGIEASLRRITHYDFWTDALRRSLLLDARLDLLVCGMGERALLEAAQRLDALHDLMGDDPAYLPPKPHTWSEVLAGIPGTARLGSAAEGLLLCQQTDAERGHEAITEHHRDAKPDPAYPSSDPISDPIYPIPDSAGQPPAYALLPSHEAMLADPKAFLAGTVRLEREAHQAQRGLVQLYGDQGSDRAVILTPSATPLRTDELDSLYALPFSRRAHPSYTAPIPAEAMIATSITTHRGCGGGCSFCSLALHQGRRIASRSKTSVLLEATTMAGQSRFCGSISDVGGPTANMWDTRCRFDATRCTRESCLYPSICKGFASHQDACVDLLHQVRAVPGVRHVRVASGVRFDLALRDPEALAAYAGEFTGGQLKIAPEHCSPEVLRLMRKPGMEPFERFLQAFKRYSEANGKEQYVIPYLMSAFPGCTDAHMSDLAQWLHARHWSPQQVQCFIPTPGTVATAMYYARCDTEGRPLYVARTDAERLRQHGLLTGDVRRDSWRNTKRFPRKTPSEVNTPTVDPQRPYPAQEKNPTQEKTPSRSAQPDCTFKSDCTPQERNSAGRNSAGRNSAGRNSAGRNVADQNASDRRSRRRSS